MNRLVKNVDALKKSAKLLQYLENPVSEQSSQLLSKHTELQSQNKEPKLEKQLADSSGKLERCKAQKVTDQHLLGTVCTALAMYKTASQQHISNCVIGREKLAAERASLFVTFQQYCADLDNRILVLQTILENEKERTGE